MRHLLLRNKIYYFRMRRPKRYQFVCSEPFIVKSLQTDSESAAMAMIPAVKAQVLADLEMRLLGRSTEKEREKYQAARDLAKAHNIRMRSVEQLASGPLEELLTRIEKVTSLDPDGKTALPLVALGRPQPPAIMLSEIAKGMDERRPHQVRHKNDRQKGIWTRKFKRAARVFVEVIGDKAIHRITEDDAFDYRRHWLGRANAPIEPVTWDYANKHLGYMRELIDAYYAEMEVDRYTNPFKDVAIRARDTGQRKESEQRKDEFEPAWIQRVVLSPGPLDKLNAEARDITIICIETGCRQSEIFDLPPSSIFLDAPVPYFSIRVEVGDLRREVKTSASIRDVALVGHALEAMKRNPQGFPRYRGNSNYYTVVNKYLKSKNLMPSPAHTLSGLRHTFESRMIRAMIDNEDRAFMMGHSMKKVRGREVYGNAISLQIKALLTEMIAFPTPNWTPRPIKTLRAEIRKILKQAGYRVD